MLISGALNNRNENALKTFNHAMNLVEKHFKKITKNANKNANANALKNFNNAMQKVDERSKELKQIVKNATKVYKNAVKKNAKAVQPNGYSNKGRQMPTNEMEKEFGYGV